MGYQGTYSHEDMVQDAALEALYRAVSDGTVSLYNADAAVDAMMAVNPSPLWGQDWQARSYQNADRSGIVFG